MNLPKYMLLTHPTMQGAEFIIRTQPPIIVGQVVKNGDKGFSVEYFATLDKSSFTDEYLKGVLKKMNDVYKFKNTW